MPQFSYSTMQKYVITSELMNTHIILYLGIILPVLLFFTPLIDQNIEVVGLIRGANPLTLCTFLPQSIFHKS